MTNHTIFDIIQHSLQLISQSTTYYIISYLKFFDVHCCTWWSVFCGSSGKIYEKETVTFRLLTEVNERQRLTSESEYIL